MVLVQLAFRYARVMRNLVSIIFALKIFAFCGNLGDAGTWVPALKLHNVPGYINTRILTGLTKTLISQSVLCEFASAHTLLMLALCDVLNNFGKYFRILLPFLSFSDNVFLNDHIIFKKKMLLILR